MYINFLYFFKKFCGFFKNLCVLDCKKTSKKMKKYFLYFYIKLQKFILNKYFLIQKNFFKLDFIKFY